MKLFGVQVSVGALQPLGRSLMLPIAVLPVAGLLLRLGQPDMFNIGFIAAAGDAIFHNLGLLFAIGVAVGFARDGNGAAGLAGVVCFLVASNGAQALIAVPPSATAGLANTTAHLAVADYRAAALFKLSVPLGILSGAIAGWLYNRFGAIKLPDYLAFFGGRRFVPIVSGLAGLVLAAIFGLGWTRLDAAIDGLSHLIVGAGPLGLFLYGLLNRLLIVTGLHHILNNIAWFIIGDFHGVTGDLNRFFAGDPTAGSFMAGFFPVMMFGLPAACLAMFHTAKPERRAEAGGLLLSLALTAMLTGVTEPIEFSFMFLAPVLYLVHAVLTGLSMVVMSLLGVKLGFGFSAGLFDFVLNFNKATRPWLLFPVGLVYFGLYYGLFRFFIQRFNLKTPGREDSATPSARKLAAQPRARAYIEALGGAANLVSVDACTTRLRLVIADQGAVDEAALKSLGARGFVRPSTRDLQVVVGATADQVAREIKDALAAGRAGRSMLSADGLLAAVGGANNLTGVETRSSRLILSVVDAERVDEAAAIASGARAVVVTSAGHVHVIVGPDAESEGHALGALISA